MSTYKQERDLVRNFGDLMEAKLRANAHKPHWRELSPGDILRRLSQEIGELRRAVKRGESPQRIASEAADVANFAAFMADNVGGLR